MTSDLHQDLLLLMSDTLVQSDIEIRAVPFSDIREKGIGTSSTQNRDWTE